MTQHSDNQYDDDLTVGMDDYESFSTDSINLFEFTGDDDSPIARLKTIILSIDWEINDDILQQLREELLDLSEIWAGDKIKQVYIQGLDKIGKYIFKERANAHPNAIKLLLTFYYNLEKIVSSDDVMSEEEKKKLLLEDVKKFDQLKAQISKSSVSSVSQKTDEAKSPAAKVKGDKGSEGLLKTLKAQVLGIDWEINDQELKKLSEEVGRLEGVFSQSKAKLILLQGIGALSSYINKMRSQSNSNAFALLHSFYGALEKITLSDLSGDDEKKILLTEVAKFNEFKADISRVKPETSVESREAGVDIGHDEPVSVVAKGTAQSFHVEEDTESLEQDDEESKVALDVESRLASVFGDIEEQELDKTDESALAGVNVETDADDDSDEEALPYEGGTVAPALTDIEEESRFSVDSLAKELVSSKEGESFLGKESELFAPQGIDVETEADDDSDEDALPMEEGELAPALSGSDEGLDFDDDQLGAGFEDTESADLANRLDSFFGDEIESSSVEWGEDEEPVLSTDEAVSSGLSFLDEEVAAPAEGESGEYPASEEEVSEAVSSGLSFLDEEVAAPAGGEPGEYPASEEEVSEAVSSGLSFLDEEVAAPAGGEPCEYPASEEEVSEAVSSGLSFLDEEVAAPAEGEPGEYPASEEEVSEAVSSGLSFLDEEVAAPAGGEPCEYPASEEEVSEAVSSGLSFLDEEVAAPAEGEPGEYPASEEEVSEAVSSGLSFLDEEVAAPAEGEPGEHPASEEEVSEAVSSGLSFLDEEVAVPVLEERDEQLIEEEEIQFTVPGEETPDAVTAEDHGDDVIEFVMPGEEVSAEPTVSASESMEVEEVIFEAVADDEAVDLLPGEEFDDSSTSDLPAEGSSVEFVEGGERPVSTFNDEKEEQLFDEYEPALPGVSQTVDSMIPPSVEDLEQDLFSEGVEESTVEKEVSSQDALLQSEEGFEEYSPDLPSSPATEQLVEENESDLFSEEYEKPSTDISGTELDEQRVDIPAAATEVVEEEIIPVASGAAAVASVTDFDESVLLPLKSCVNSLQKDVTGESLQALLDEVNFLRGRQTFSSTEKIFLQLLSSICQHMRTYWEEPCSPALQLLLKVFSALEVSRTSTTTVDLIQQQLLECTSQVLLLQQKTFGRLLPERVEAQVSDVFSTGTGMETEPGTLVSGKVASSLPSETKDMLIAMFQQEMVQMRQTFLDEISSLRKELIDRK